MWCKVCGGEIYPGIESVNGTHADADYCVVILNARVEHELTRAEAAENDLCELRENTLLSLGLNPVDVAAGMEDQSIAYLLGGLKQRVAELEARLAESVARAERNQGSADVLDEIEELMFGWEDDD